MKPYTRPLGQERLKGFFDNIIKSQRLSHAYIFEGEAGIGKKTMAEYFSLMILCKDNCACLECNNCVCSVSGTNPDLVWVDKGDKATIPVDKIREVIKEIYLKPKMCQKRVFIIDEAHLMNDAAQNALLKVIENPPEYAVFILLTQNKHMLLPTVLSRSVVIKISPLDRDNLIKVTPSPNDVAAKFSKGNPGKYKELCQDEEFLTVREEFFSVIGSIFSNDEYRIYKILDFFEKYKEKRNTLFELMTIYFEDIMFAKNNSANLITNADKKRNISESAKAINDKQSVKLLKIVLDTEREMGKYGSFSISMQAMLVKMWEEIHG